jgi:hypothetical protein
MYSVVNLAIWSWAYIWVTNKYMDHNISDSMYYLYLLLISLFGGLILSLIVGVIIQKRIIGWLATKLHLNSVDPADSSWDWLFTKYESHQILITLKDNTEICGWYGKNSFTSSDPAERDMFVEYIYKKDENGYYFDNPDNHGLYISKDQIKFIELKS